MGPKQASESRNFVPRYKDAQRIPPKSINDYPVKSEMPAIYTGDNWAIRHDALANIREAQIESPLGFDTNFLEGFHNLFIRGSVLSWVDQLIELLDR